MTLDEQISWLDDGSPAIPRLGLPAYSWEAEALHGVSWNGVATVFPQARCPPAGATVVVAPTCRACRPPTKQNIAWGATFDEGLVAEIGAAIAVEARAKWLEGLAPDGSSAEFAGLSFM